MDWLNYELATVNITVGTLVAALIAVCAWSFVRGFIQAVIRDRQRKGR